MFRARDGTSWHSGLIGHGHGADSDGSSDQPRSQCGLGAAARSGNELLRGRRFVHRCGCINAARDGSRCSILQEASKDPGIKRTKDSLGIYVGLTVCIR